MPRILRLSSSRPRPLAAVPALLRLVVVPCLNAHKRHVRDPPPFRITLLGTHYNDITGSTQNRTRPQADVDYARKPGLASRAFTPCFGGTVRSGTLFIGLGSTAAADRGFLQSFVQRFVRSFFDLRIIPQAERITNASVHFL